MEWHSQDKFNSFNSWKNLLYIPWYEEIKKWKDNPQHKILPPIEASIDASPAGVCNLKCTFCNAHKFVGKTSIVSDKDFIDLHKFLLDWGVLAFCFTGDTKVKLVNGTHKTFEELTEEWNKNKTPFEVYSRDENNNIVPGVAYEPRKTREVYEIIELRLDNNKIIKCTPDHRFMLRDGTYKEAKDLTKNDSLMPLYTKLTGGYEFIKDITYQGSTHKLFSSYYNGNKEKLKTNELVVHHKNYNKLDNTKNNLQQVTPLEHGIIHTPVGKHKEKLILGRDKWNKSSEGILCHKKQIKLAQKKARIYWNSTEGKKHNAEKIIKYNKSEKGRKRSGEIFSKYNATLEGIRNSIIQFKRYNSSKQHLLNNKNPKYILQRKLGKVNKIINRLKENKLEVNEKNYNLYWANGFPKWRKAQDLIVYNHKIMSKKLIKLNNPISVYCLTVEKYHNFALSSGVFVKNCEGGGGEPTMRKNLPEIFKLIKTYNRQSSLTTNGTNFTDELIDTLAECCRWVGISVDSSNKDTYMRIRGVDCFNKTTNNMSKLVNKVNELKTNCDVSYKFLITPDNYTEIYDACKLAKEIGVKEFHARPADMSHQGMGENKLKDYEYAVKNIEEQFEKCHQLRTENFRVFCVSHKFDSNFKPLKNFNQCYAMPILIQCCPDGNVYSCVDQRLVDDFKLGSYLPNPKQILDFWGGEKHHKLVFGDTPKKCPGRCTFTMFNETCQRIVIEEEQDYMCKWFT